MMAVEMLVDAILKGELSYYQGDRQLRLRSSV